MRSSTSTGIVGDSYQDDDHLSQTTDFDHSLSHVTDHLTREVPPTLRVKTHVAAMGGAPCISHDPTQNREEPEIEKPSALIPYSFFGKTPRRMDSCDAQELCRNVTHHLQLGRELGRGKYGTVYEATIVYSDDTTFPCVAKANDPKKTLTECDDETVLHELLTRGSNASTETGLLNWVCTYPYTDEQGKTQRYNVMSKCDLILDGVIDEISALKATEKPMWESLVYSLLLSFLKSLSSLKNREFNHGDIKPANIGLKFRKDPRSPNEIPCWVLLDFGTLTTSQEQAERFKGSPHYMSPEVCAGKGDMSISRDIYAIGQILAELNGQATRVEETVEAISYAKGTEYEAARVAGKKTTRTKEKIQSSMHFNDLLQTLIKAMLEPLPENRADLEILNSAIQKMLSMLPHDHAERASKYLSTHKEKAVIKRENWAGAATINQDDRAVAVTSVSVSF